MFCVSHPNLVILAWTADELSCGQASDWYTHTDTRTDTQTQAMTIPEGQNWPRVKMLLIIAVTNFFLRVLITQVQNDQSSKLRNSKKHNFWKIYHSWFGTDDNKTSVIERKQNHKLWIINTAFIRGFPCTLNFAVSWIQCPYNEINNNNWVNFKKSRSQCVSLTEKVLHRNYIIKLNDSQVGFV